MFVKLKDGRTLNLQDASWIGATFDCHTVAAFGDRTETLLSFRTDTDGIVRSVLAAKAIRDAMNQGCLAFNLYGLDLESEVSAAAENLTATLKTLGDVVSDTTAFKRALEALRNISKDSA